MKKLIEWAELEISRGRKLMLFSIIFVFMLLTIGIFLVFVLGFGAYLTGFYTYYTTYSVVAGTAIGFYTSTKSTKGDNDDK